MLTLSRSVFDLSQIPVDRAPGPWAEPVGGMPGFVVCCEEGAGRSLRGACDDGLIVILSLITVLQAQG